MPAWVRKPCITCGAPKLPGRGQLYCADCKQAAKERQQTKQRAYVEAHRQSCKQCGGPKEPGCGRVTCDECRKLAEWKRERRKVAQTTLKRKPCKGCSGLKGPGTSYQYCPACREKRTIRPCRGQGCTNTVLRSGVERLCAECREKRVEQQRAKWREYKARYRQDPEKLTQMKLAQRRYRQSTKGRTKERYRRRIAYRLKKERAGGELVTMTTVDRSQGPSLPGVPLARAISAVAFRRAISIPDLCEHIGLEERDVTRWRIGESNPSLPAVDLVLTRLELVWWSVWNEDTVRVPMLVATVYRLRMKGGKTRRTRARSTRYGDLGPDLDELRRIELVLDGDRAVAA